MKRYYLFGALGILVAFGLGIIAGMFATRAYEVPLEPTKLKEYGYRLLTWKGKSGDLCFALMPRYKAWKFENNFFSKWNGTCGLSLLKEELAALPKGETVEWANYPSPKFNYINRKTEEEVAEFAKSKGLDFHENPTLDAQVYADGPF